MGERLTRLSTVSNQALMCEGRLHHESLNIRHNTTHSSLSESQFHNM